MSLAGESVKSVDVCERTIGKRTFGRCVGSFRLCRCVVRIVSFVRPTRDGKDVAADRNDPTALQSELSKNIKAGFSEWSPLLTDFLVA